MTSWRIWKLFISFIQLIAAVLMGFGSVRFDHLLDEVDLFHSSPDASGSSVRVVPVFRTLARRSDPDMAIAIATSEGQPILAWSVPTAEGEIIKYSSPPFVYPICHTLRTETCSGVQVKTFKLGLFRASLPIDLRDRTEPFCLMDLEVLGERVGDWREFDLSSNSDDVGGRSRIEGPSRPPSVQCERAAVSIYADSPFADRFTVVVELIIDDDEKTPWEHVPIANIEILDAVTRLGWSSVVVQGPNKPFDWNAQLAFTVEGGPPRREVLQDSEYVVVISCDEQLIDEDPFSRPGWIGVISVPASVKWKE